MLSPKTKINSRSSFQSFSQRRAFPFIFRGSLTVECALALPLFFLVLLVVISYMNAIGLQVSENLKTSATARKLAMSAYTLESQYDDDVGERVWIDLPSSVSYTLPVSLFSVKEIKVALRARVYPWIGNRDQTDGDNDDQNNKMVYITENEEVYHTYSDCTHLDLTIRNASLSEVKKLRNDYGKHYKACSGFPRNYKGTVYVTAKGDYYYPSTTCGSLTRHVRMVRLSEVGNLRECSRCAGRSVNAAA